MALAILYDNSGSMKQSVRDANGRQTPKYVIARRALESVIHRLQNFATNTPRKIEAGLKSAGAALKDLTRLTIFVTDIRDMGAVSKALAKALKGSVVTSTLVAVSALAVSGLLVEIESTAVVKG